jgi:integrase
MNIQKPTQREKLKARHAPYWRELERGCSIGYRKSESGHETWLFRYRYTDTDGVRRYVFDSTAMHRDGIIVSYSDAKSLAEKFFAAHRQSPGARRTTVGEACRSYEKTLMGATLVSVRGAFRQLVYDAKEDGTFIDKGTGVIRLDRLTVQDVKNFKASLLTTKRGPEAANRMLMMLKAALNQAYREGLVESDRPWKVVQSFRKDEDLRTKKPNTKRVYLDLDQRRAFLEACPDDLALIVKGLLITGARPGELVACKRSDLDLTLGRLRLVTTKGGRRQERERFFPLKGTNLEFFKKVGANKLPNAPLFIREDGTDWVWGARWFAWNAMLPAIRKKVELPAHYIRMHNLRHTAIPDWLMAGMEIGMVAVQAGTSVRMIEKHYGKYIRSHAEDILSRVQAF